MPSPRTVRVLAPAKINLCLHVTGRRDDGYHLLDSLVAFAPFGDFVTVAEACGLSLEIDGPEAAGLDPGPGNLVWRAAELIGRPAAIRLQKVLPVASGLGGGSADAAATVRALMVLAGDPAAAAAADRHGLDRLGADVPMCLHSRSLRVRGIGERLDPIPPLPLVPALVVNPRRPLATAAVFRALARADNPGLPDRVPMFLEVESLAIWLAGQRNDLEAPAMALEPAVGEVLAALRSLDGCLLARMSGSGASCFALFPTVDAMKTAGARLHAAHPDWWKAPAVLGDQSVVARPQVLS